MVNLDSFRNAVVGKTSLFLKLAVHGLNHAVSLRGDKDCGEQGTVRELPEEHAFRLDLEGKDLHLPRPIGSAANWL